MRGENATARPRSMRTLGISNRKELGLQVCLLVRTFVAPISRFYFWYVSISCFLVQGVHAGVLRPDQLALAQMQDAHLNCV